LVEASLRGNTTVQVTMQPCKGAASQPVQHEPTQVGKKDLHLEQKNALLCQGNDRHVSEMHYQKLQGLKAD